MFNYSYALAALFFIVVWVVLFITLPRSRPAMFWTSLFFALAGPIGEHWLIPAYWHPFYLINVAIGRWHFGFEDYLITFAVGGIAAAVFESIALRAGFAKPGNRSWGTFFQMGFWGVIGLMLMALLASGLRMNPIHAILFTVTLCALLMLYGHWRILAFALPVAAGIGIGYWLFLVFIYRPIFPGVIPALWNIKNTWGIMLVGVPIEELLWAFSTALFAGPVYRICSARTL